MAKKATAEAASPYTEEGMRNRFWEIDAIRTEKLKVLDAKRDERDKHNAKFEEKSRQMHDEIKQLNAELAPLDDERSRLSKALGGKTGTDADTPFDPADRIALNAELAEQAEADAADQPDSPEPLDPAKLN